MGLASKALEGFWASEHPDSNQTVGTSGCGLNYWNRGLGGSVLLYKYLEI